jgi:hypothetical protein
LWPDNRFVLFRLLVVFTFCPIKRIIDKQPYLLFYGGA